MAGALTAARWLAEPAQAEQRRRFEATYAGWRERFGDLVDRAHEAAARSNGAVFQRVFREGIERGLMCPFNHEGSCDIYPVRPAVCREKIALDSAEPCSRHQPGSVGTFVGLDTFMYRIRSVDRVMQASLRPRPDDDAARMPVAERVAELLAERPPPGRNDPCSCGSGKKYKKCCGAER